MIVFTCTQDQISRLQQNLQTIRMAGGWSTSEFGNLLGVSKQTVCNLENGTSKLNKMQYIGIRTILEYEMAQNPDNKVLAYTVNLLLDSEQVTEEDEKKAKQAIAYVSGAKATGLDSALIAAGLTAILGVALSSMIFGPGKAALCSTTTWLSKLMQHEN